MEKKVPSTRLRHLNRDGAKPGGMLMPAGESDCSAIAADWLT